METQMKQRIVGVVVLLILIAAIVALLFYGAKQNENLDLGKKSQVDANKTEVQLTLPVDGQSQTVSTTGIDATPRDTVPANKSPVDTVQPSAAAAPVQPATTAADMVANDNKSDNKVDNIAPAAVPTAPSTTPSTIQATTPVTPTVATATDNVTAQAAAPAAVNSAVNPSVVKPTTEAIPVAAAAPVVPEATTPPAATEEEPATDNKAAPVAASPVKQKNLSKTTITKKVNYAPRGTWAVRTGCFVAPPNADSMTKSLQKHGYKVYKSLLVTDKGVLSQVFVGPVQTRAQALVLSRDLKKKMHFNGIVMNTAAKAAPAKALSKGAAVKSKVKVKKVKTRIKAKKVPVQQAQAQ